jgi:hypothetical protein
MVKLNKKMDIFFVFFLKYINLKSQGGYPKVDQIFLWELNK